MRVCPFTYLSRELRMLSINGTDRDVRDAKVLFEN